MIPKIIHYCWFGHGALPPAAQRCIASWRRRFPDYEIKEWNESNFDVNLMPFTQEAYAAGKYAFVSDVARFWILEREGGIYFDTDVEVVGDFSDIVARGAFMGIETLSDGTTMPGVNPGLALGAEPGNPVVRSILDHYRTQHYQNANGKKIPGTVVTHTTKVLAEQYGLQPTNELQQLNGVTIYPMDYFNPFNDLTGRMERTKNTRSIHWFAKSWQDAPMWYFRMTRLLHRIFGTRVLGTFKSFFKKEHNC